MPFLALLKVISDHITADNVHQFIDLVSNLSDLHQSMSSPDCDCKNNKAPNS